MNSKSTYFIVATIAVIVIGTVGYLGWVRKQEITPVHPTSPPPDDLADETANWKTYRNKKYEFEIKYHPEWTIDFNRNNTLLINGGAGTYVSNPSDANEISLNGPGCSRCFLSIKEVESITFDQLSKSYDSPPLARPLLSKKEIKINGIPALDTLANLPGFYSRSIAFIDTRSAVKKVITFLYDFPGEPTKTPAFEAMLSSFRFVE